MSKKREKIKIQNLESFSLDKILDKVKERQEKDINKKLEKEENKHGKSLKY